MEKIKEGAIEVLMEKEQEILTLKMKIEKLECLSPENTASFLNKLLPFKLNLVLLSKSLKDQEEVIFSLKVKFYSFRSFIK